MLTRNFVYLFFIVFANCTLFCDISTATEDLKHFSPQEQHAPAAPPFKGDHEHTSLELEDQDLFYNELMKMFVILTFFVIALFFLNWMLKRMGQTKIDQMNASSAIKILERRTLSPKSLIYLIEIHGHTVAIAESPSGITRIAEISQENLLEDSGAE